MPFQSKFQFNEKLKLCAARDDQHIGLSTFPVADRKGDHVGLIQLALNTWAAKQTPPLAPLGGAEVAKMEFGPATAEMVARYKRLHAPPIVNYANAIDNIVGKKTVVALDLELPPAGGDVVVTRKALDIIVSFIGAAAAGPLSEDEVLNPAALRNYNASGRRLLMRIGARTNTTDAGSAILINGFVEEIKLLRRVALANGRDAGALILFGASSGGRNIRDLEIKLAQAGVIADYVAIVDVPIFTSDNPGRPLNVENNPPVLPNLGGPAPRARIAKNFFQTAGNHGEDSTAHGLLFFSHIDGKEVHGSVNGYTSFDRTAQTVGAATPLAGETLDDTFHRTVSAVVRTEIINDVQSILTALP